MSATGLNVIALVSGGKDSFFSVLHCIRNGHRVIALANLYPSSTTSAGADAQDGQHGEADTEVEIFQPDMSRASLERRQSGEARPNWGDTDLNSFMYQTVGHQIIPLFAIATGIPLYRRRITGTAVQDGRDYDGAIPKLDLQGENIQDKDETESLVPLLREVMRRHPDANAVCAGAILSTYQRTRVESVATRLDLVPLAYLWKFPVLPLSSAPAGGADTASLTSEALSVVETGSAGPSTTSLTAGRSKNHLRHAADDGQLLRDMASAGLYARLVKVASAGLDESFLWECISSEAGLERARRALRRFGTAGGGAILGEGGEFETVVVDGPPSLFRKKIVVDEAGRRVVREGGGCSWLQLDGARLEEKNGNNDGVEEVRVPGLFDAKFEDILQSLLEIGHVPADESCLLGGDGVLDLNNRQNLPESREIRELHWSLKGDADGRWSSIEDETRSIVKQFQTKMQCYPGEPLSPMDVTNTVILLRRMIDFPAVNKIYGPLFPFPNPPSRVTISCGDGLPEGCNIVVCLSLRRGLSRQDRRGLHVQSRSYWAPANIGPYSQAIDVPIHSSPQGPRIVSIAGQIPLVPSTLDLPPPSRISTELQVALSLQHLWRIGIDVGVQLWTSAVAYFPTAESAEAMAGQAGLAAKAWRLAHRDGQDDAEQDGEVGPDLWDRRYNPEFMSYNQPPKHAQLPDWETFQDSTEGVPHRSPPFFAVEVEELPRQAGIEWHAHVGLSSLESNSVQMVWCSAVSATGSAFTAQVQQTLVKTGQESNFLHTVVSLPTGVEPSVATLRQVWLASVGRLGAAGAVLRETVSSPYLVYADRSHCIALEGEGWPAIPCKSIWSEAGLRMGTVALFRTT